MEKNSDERELRCVCTHTIPIALLQETKAILSVITKIYFNGKNYLRLHAYTWQKRFSLNFFTLVVLIAN